MNKIILIIIVVILVILFTNSNFSTIEGFNNNIWAYNPYTIEYKPAKTRDGAYRYLKTQPYRTNRFLAHMEHTRHPCLMNHKYEYDDTRCYAPQFRRFNSARLNELKNA